MVVGEVFVLGLGDGMLREEVLLADMLENWNSVMIWGRRLISVLGCSLHACRLAGCLIGFMDAKWWGGDCGWSGTTCVGSRVTLFANPSRRNFAALYSTRIMFCVLGQSWKQSEGN